MLLPTSNSSPGDTRAGRESSQTSSDRALRCRLAILGVPFVLAALHMAVFDRGLGGDGWATFAFLESAVEDGDLALENNNHGVMNGLMTGPGGHVVMQYPPGVALLDLAPYLAGRTLDRLLPARWLASGVVVSPVGRVPRRMLFEVAAIVATRNLEVLAGLVAILVALRRAGFEVRTAALTTTVVFFGGPLVFYSLVGPATPPPSPSPPCCSWCSHGIRVNEGHAASFLPD